MGNENQKDRLALSELGRRFNDYLHYAGLSKNEIAEKLGVSARSIANIMAGKNFDSHILIQSGELFPRLNMSWLVLGVGEMILDQPTTSWESRLEELQVEMNTIAEPKQPLLDKQAKERTLAHYAVLDKAIDLFFHVTGEMVYTQEQLINLLASREK